MRSTPSRFKLSSSIRAPESFTALSSMRASLGTSWGCIWLEEPGRRQALLDVFDAVAVRSAERRPARSAVEALQVQRRLEAADAEAARRRRDPPASCATRSLAPRPTAPASRSAYTSQNSRAAIVASARMPPDAPMGRAGSSAAAEPTITWKLLGVRWMMCAACGMLPEESLMPQTFGCSAMRATVSGSRLIAGVDREVVEDDGDRRSLCDREVVPHLAPGRAKPFVK